MNEFLIIGVIAVLMFVGLFGSVWFLQKLLYYFMDGCWHKWKYDRSVLSMSRYICTKCGREKIEDCDP